MNEKALALLKQVRDFWRSLSTPKRISLVLVTVGMLVAVLTTSYLTSRQTYTYLFTEVAPEDGAAITAKLKELKVPYRVEANGTAILVPDERVHELRLDLAGQGLPRGGGVGFEIFDKAHLGATEFEQRINLRRALEGELGRTIGTIAAVQTARVHLVLPEHSVFAVGHQEATASVVLHLRPGRPFGHGEVTSVVHLVASAVPGLSAESVSIVSADGLMLHRPRSDTGSGGIAAGDTQADHERELAAPLEEQARALLERVVGPGRAEVRVGLTLDTAARDKTEEHYEPSKTALRSEQKTEERNAGEGPSVAGVPGAISNLPDGTAEHTEGVNGAGAFRTSWTRNWEVDRITEHTTTPAGRVARLSVAVLVDGSYRGAPGARQFIPRDKVEMDRFADLVKGAVGFNAERGDMLSIEAAQFAVGDGAEGVANDLTRLQRPWWMYAAAAFGAVFVVAMLVLLWRPRRDRAAARRIALGLEPAGRLAQGAQGPGLVGQANVLESADVPRGLPGAAAPNVLGPGVARAQAIEIASRDPATAAIILRAWLNAPPSSGTAPARF